MCVEHSMMRVFITIEWRMISMVKTVKGDNFEDIKACGVAGGCGFLSNMVRTMQDDGTGISHGCR